MRVLWPHDLHVETKAQVIATCATSRDWEVAVFQIQICPTRSPWSVGPFALPSWQELALPHTRGNVPALAQILHGPHAPAIVQVCCLLEATPASPMVPYARISP